MNPVVRHMLVCEDVRFRPQKPHKVDIFGLLSTAVADAFPFRLSFSVLLMLTEGRGAGTYQVAVLDADTESEVYSGEINSIAFAPDPRQVVGLIVRVPSCEFEREGLYRVAFRYNGKELEDQPLLVKGKP